MTRHDTISLALNAACRGYPQALQALLYAFALEAEIPLDRIVKIAYRRFGIPPSVTWTAICDLCPVLIQ